MNLPQAKDFIYRELEEVAVRGLGRGAWLSEEAETFRLHLGPFPLENTVCLELANGLQEWVAPTSAHTCRLEFSRAAGWGRSQVDQWLQRHLQVRDLGRTMMLQVPYRMKNELGGLLGDILFAGEYLVPSRQTDAGLEFIAVPPLRKEPKSKAGANGVAALPREGAGLEQDLTAQRSADRVPADLRAELPRRGFANYLEAQAVIRKAEELLNQGAGGRDPLAIVALHEGQVDLLRRLAARSALMQSQVHSWEIGLPAAFQERERATVLLSLTRSHAHRAVPFGERVTDLPLAMTRARDRLVVFGDPGALVKRSHWQGPLDHLDMAAAGLEARRITALVRWLSTAFQISP